MPFGFSFISFHFGLTQTPFVRTVLYKQHQEPTSRERDSWNLILDSPARWDAGQNLNQIVDSPARWDERDDQDIGGTNIDRVNCRAAFAAPIEWLVKTWRKRSTQGFGASEKLSNFGFLTFWGHIGVVTVGSHDQNMWLPRSKTRTKRSRLQQRRSRPKHWCLQSWKSLPQHGNSQGRKRGPRDVNSPRLKATTTRLL